MIFAHQIALDLTQDQEAYCRRAAGTARFTYNWALAEWQRQYQAGEKPTVVQLKKQWNAIKHESDMGFGAFRRMLMYKAEAAGVNIVVADRWFPSSKMCSQCGVVADNLPLGQRVFACACGFVTDRDLNAALNLHNYPRLVGK
jgi:transposase